MPVILDPPAPTPPAPDPGPLPSAGDRLYARLEPVAYADEENGFALKQLAAALSGPRQIIDDIVRDRLDGTIGWGPATDPDTVPDELLDWLAQWPGVIFPPSALTADEKRARVMAAAGFRRGTVQAMREEIQMTLTGTKTVRIVERVNYNAYWITVITIPGETSDAAATLRAALSQKPGGHRLDYYTTAEALIDEGTIAIDSVGAAVTIDAVTLPDVAP